MKKETFLKIRLFLWAFVIGMLFELVLNTYRTKYDMKDYQIQINGSNITVYDSCRLIGKCSYYNTELEKLIINDNQ